MAFDSTTRAKLQRLVAACRKLLTEEFDDQLQSLYGIYAKDGRVLELDKLASLDDDQRAIGALLRERIAHLQSGLTGSKTPLADAVQRVLREQAFTLLNRFAALRMAEERDLVLQCVGDGLNSKGFQVFENVASPDLGSQYERYRVFLDCLFDELSLDLGILFDRFSPFGLLFPREPKLKVFLALLNDPELKSLWREDETIGWIYQYFNDEAERKKMRKDSPAPRNSRELAVRNQFFTPRYVVEFLTDNTLGRLWHEMTCGETALRDRCRYLVSRPTEIFLKESESAPQDTPSSGAQGNSSQEVLLRTPVHIPYRPLKDPRTIRVLDPACGSMHFGLYAFDLFECIYDEAWEIAHGSDDALKSAPSFTPFVAYAAQFADKTTFLREVPRLIIEHNLHGIDIDPRAAQIAGLSLWLRAHRAWQRRGVKPAERPRITRSNLVCAEPMPGEKELLREFVEGAFPAGERPAFAFLLEKIFDCMTLAGEAGSLLRIEAEIRTAIAEARALAQRQSTLRQAGLFAGTERLEQEELNLRGLTTEEQFWEKAEERIYEALETYAEQAENGGGFQRRLFADDAAQGFAFIDLCRKRYDVVVMNPPFGAFSRGSKTYGAETFPDSAHDIFAAFVECSLGRLNERCFLGAISSRTGFFIASFADWRREILQSQVRLLCFADLGVGVMDNATVEAAAYVLERSATGMNSSEPAPYLRLLSYPDKQPHLANAINAFRENLSPTRDLFWAAQDQFALLPDAPFVYWARAQTLRKLSKWPRFEPTAAQVRKGLRTGDNYRFVRALWELPSEVFTPSIASSYSARQKEESYWVPLVLSGSSQPWFSPIIVALNWRQNGKELRQYVTKYGSPSRLIQAEDFYFRPGMSWTRRAARFIPYAIPAGCIPTGSRPMAFPDDGNEFLSLAVTASRVATEFMRFYGDWFTRPNFLEGKVKLTPWPEISEEQSALLHDYVRSECESRRRAYRGHEPFLEFLKPFALDVGDGASNVTIDWNTLLGADREVIVEAALGLSSEEASELGRDLDEALSIRNTGSHSDEEDEEDEDAELVLDVSPRSYFDALLSYAIGCAFGRWDIRYATGEREEPDLPDPFAPLPVCPPGMLQSKDGLPLSTEVGRCLRTSENYPLDAAWDGILVDDPEHILNLDHCVHVVLQLLWGGRSDEVEHKACDLLGVTSLREYFRRFSDKGFFADHLARYTKSKRKAPIYWPLSTVSGSYTIWLYYPRLTDQTLYRSVTDFVKPKLDAVTADVNRLQSKAQTCTARERDELEEVSDFQSELQDLHDELLRVAQFPWKPNLNDGVLITASPLWKLFRLPKWQKDLKACWEELAAGDYDWAHLAHSIWVDDDSRKNARGERVPSVREKCKKDRSLAIAHGLEDLCEVEAPKPKAPRRAKADAAALEREAKKEAIRDELTEALANILLGEKIPLDVTNGQTGEIIIPANRKITKTLLRKLACIHNHAEIAPSPIRNKIREIIGKFEPRLAALETTEQTELLMRPELTDLPAPRAAAPTVREAKVVSDEAPAAALIDQIDRTEVLCVIRGVFSSGGARDRETAMRDVAQALGFQRLGSHIREILSTDFLTAVRRGILVNENGQLSLGASDLRDYDRDSMKGDFLGAIGRTWTEREDAIRLFARWLGYARTGYVIEETARSLINGLIREGRLEKDGDRIRRIS